MAIPEAAFSVLQLNDTSYAVRLALYVTAKLLLFNWLSFRSFLKVVQVICTSRVIAAADH